MIPKRAVIMENIVIGRDKEDLKKYGEKGTAFMGKHIVGKGEDAHLTNPIMMDVTRPHVLLVCGKRGTGKCVSEDTLITLDDGTVVPIKDLDGNNQHVYGLNNMLKVRPQEKTGFFKRQVNKLLHIKLRSGKEIKLTHEHPLLTVNGWVQAADLMKGCRIAASRKIEIFGNEPIDENRIKIIAYLLAEGHMGNEFILFSNKDEILIKDFFVSVKKFDPGLKINTHEGVSYRVSKKKRSIEQVIIKRDDKGRFEKGTICKPKKSTLRLWLEEIGLYNKMSIEKTIPSMIFKLPKHHLSIFLNRMFSCDGSIYKRKAGTNFLWELSYASSSKVMIQQIQHLLLRFGILSRIREKKHKLNGKMFGSFELTIHAKGIVKFINEIGFFGKKMERQKHALHDVTGLIRNPNVDVIPKEVWDIYRPCNWAEAGRQMGYSIPKGLRSSINYGPSRQKLKQIARIDNNYQMYLLATSDIFWDEISNIETLNGKFNAYDITVPECHNFVANDIIVHNSYSAGLVAEEIAALPDEIKNNLSVILIDTMGIYWSMKNPNDKDKDILKGWGLKAAGLDTKLFIPEGYTDDYEQAGVTYDNTFNLVCSDLSAEDWILTFGFSFIDEFGITIERVIKQVKKAKAKSAYSIRDIISAIEADKGADQKVKDALVNRFSAAEGWGIFGKSGVSTKDLVKPGTVSIIDVSHYMQISEGWSVRSMLIGLLSRKIFHERLMARKAEELEVMTGETRTTMPMVWMMIDEAHQFLPTEGKTSATEPLLTLVKQGREPGISLLFITQRPNKLHEDALAQSDIIIAHRLTAKADLQALRGIMQTYMLEDIQEYINALPRQKGTAIVLDDNSERIYTMQARPRKTWHAGGSPIAIKESSILG